MKKITTVFLMVGMFSLVGCEEKVYDVTYYKDHVREARDIVLKCRAGDMSGDNCANSKQAILSVNMALTVFPTEAIKAKYNDEEKEIVSETAKLIKS